MKMLEKAGFDKAREFLLAGARPLERALFRTYFEDETAEKVWLELAAFQNEAGGFGRGLEPDMRSPSSSALATGIGLRLLAETGAPAGHPLVGKSISYLRQTLDPHSLTWRVIPPDANEYPHAPWWHDEDGSLAETFGDYEIIPRAELVAYLTHFAAVVDQSWLETLRESTIRAIEETPLGGGGGSDLEYALHLTEAPNLPQPQRERMLRRVREVAPTAVTRDPEQWKTYCVPPLKLAPSPDSPVADLFADDIQRNLDYVIETQTEGGYWEPTWSWGSFYPDTWPSARNEWRGIITLHNMLSLRDYGRLG